jgi:hypothetical protein
MHPRGAAARTQLPSGNPGGAERRMGGRRVFLIGALEGAVAVVVAVDPQAFFTCGRSSKSNC